MVGALRVRRGSDSPPAGDVRYAGEEKPSDSRILVGGEPRGAASRGGNTRGDVLASQNCPMEVTRVLASPPVALGPILGTSQ